MAASSSSSFLVFCCICLVLTLRAISAAPATTTSTYSSTSTSTTASTTTASNTTASANYNSTTTTAAPQPPFSCYDCNSGNPSGWVDPNCAASGVGIQSWYIQDNCQTFCFSRVGLYPAGSVFRGCASNLHLTNDQLQEGCFNRTSNNDRICLCSGDTCNTDDLTAHSAYYIEQSQNAV